jgi:hypothetical protein
MTSWEKELVKELDITWGDAKAILQIAKSELGIDPNEYPEDAKQEIFTKCKEVSVTFEKTPKPEEVLHPRESRLAEQAKKAEKEEQAPKDEPTETEEEDGKIERQKWEIIFVIVMVVVLLIVVISLGVSNRKKSDAEAESSATSAPSGTVSPGCNATVMDFSVPSVALKVKVDSTISTLEIDYAANVFMKTYTAMLENEVESAGASNYCDPYCREISHVEVASADFTNDVVEDDATDGCDAYLEMVFAVNGTYTACEGTPFPGLFTPSSTRRLMPSYESTLRGGGLSSQRNGMNRFLDSDASTCGVCSVGGNSIAYVAPTIEELTEQVEPYVTVLPSVCELVSVDILEVAK